MTRSILSAIWIAAMLLTAASGEVLSEDFNIRNKNVGASAKDAKNTPGTSQTTSVGGVQAAGTKGSQATGWPSKYRGLTPVDIERAPSK